MAPSRNQDSSDRAECEYEEDMSHEEMKRLLRRADDRIRAAIKAPSSNENVCSLEESSVVQRLPSLKSKALIAPYIASLDGIARSDPEQMLRDRENELPSLQRHSKKHTERKERRKKGKEATAGPDWYHLPRMKLTTELKRDLQILKMRGVLDPKRHYKTDTSKTLISEFAQVGSIVEGPTEFFSSRVPHKQRKETFVEEILGDTQVTNRFGAKYKNLQASKASGKRSHYQALKEKRHRGGHRRGY